MTHPPSFAPAEFAIQKKLTRREPVADNSRSTTVETRHTAARDMSRMVTEVTRAA